MPKTPLEAQYEARIRRIMSGFPQDTTPTATLVAAKGPVHVLVTRHGKTAGKIPAAKLQKCPHDAIEALLCRRRQRNRVIRQRAQVTDHTGAFAVLCYTGKTHRGAGDVTLRVGEEFVQLVIGPGA